MPIRAPADLRLITTPVRYAAFWAFLCDTPRACFLVEGFRYGFHIPHLYVALSLVCPNHRSAYKHAAFLDDYIHNGHISQPFTLPPLRTFVSSLLGVIPKNVAGSFRVIHDLSFLGCAVNDLIPQDLTSVSYEDFDVVAQLVMRAGQGALIARVNIQSAFHIMPIHPADRHLWVSHGRIVFIRIIVCLLVVPCQVLCLNVFLLHCS